jgi:lysophospholipase L1-like esterase
MRSVAKGLALLIAILAGVELVLVFALVAVDRSGAWRPGARERVLCVGDSHTYGAGVRSDEAYPAQLQVLLDEAAPGVYSVVNRGVPGYNSLQVRNRLPQWIAELRPTVIVVVVGVNNTWNEAGFRLPGEPWTSRLRQALLHLRLVRLVEVWRAHRALDATLDHNQLPFGDRPEYRLDGKRGGFVAWDDGAGEEFAPMTRRPVASSRAIRRALDDYTAMVRTTRRDGVRLVFLGYPTRIPLFVPFSDAMSQLAAREHVDFVDAADATQRVPPGRQTWTFGAHAGPAGLTEIARDVAATIRAAPPAAPAVGTAGSGS